MGRNQQAVLTGFQYDFEKIASIQAEYGTAVGIEIADGVQAVVEALHTPPIREKNQVVVLSGSALFLVDTAYFTTEQEPNRRPARRGDGLVTSRSDVGPKPIEARFGRLKLLADFGKPLRMRKITRADHGDAF